MLVVTPQTVDIGQSLRFQDSSARETYTSFGGLISNVLPNVYIAAGVILLFLIISGGLIMILNSGNQDAQANGKKVITGAIIGLVALFASFWIIQIIQVLTGIKIIGSGL